ncbi:MAG: (Fe-S)-binding protein [bacterium]
MDTKHLKEWEKELDICIRCSYCFEDCPVFKELGWESSSARAKILYAYGLLHGEMEPSGFVARRIFDCTLCRLCKEKCSAKVNITEIIEACRADLAKEGYLLPEHKQMLENIVSTGNIFGDKEVQPPVQEGETPLFVGCQYLARPNRTKGWIRLLEKMGVSPRVSEETCCGFPLKALGQTEELEKQRETLKKLFPYKEAITLCPTCAEFLNEHYGVETKHVVSVVLEKLNGLKPRRIGKKVTYHDPCDLGRGLGVFEEPRDVLRKLGAELVEMKGNRTLSICCGGGGGMLVSDLPTSDRIAEKRIRQALDTGADLLVTACPTCEQVLSKASARMSEKGEENIKVQEIFELLWNAVK